MNNIASLQPAQKQISLPVKSKEKSGDFYQALWLCAYFPKLAVHSLEIDEKQSDPFVIFEADTQKRTIHYASTAAQQLGIESGMDLSQAYILCEQIKTYQRDQKKEQALIKLLADWAVQFSSYVSIKYSSSILIEIRGSIKLFSGICRLQKNIARQLRKKGYLSSIAISPAPLASFIFSKASRNVVIEDKKTLRAELGQLEIQDFLFDHKSLEKLHNIGIQTGYELFRLSPTSLGRRFGNGFCRYLNELLGIIDENIAPVSMQTSFYDFYEFQKDQENLEIIMVHAGILLKNLMRFLIQRELSTRKLKFSIHSSNKNKQSVIINSNTQCRDEKVWINLIKEKFYFIPIRNSVYKISLHVDTFEAHAYQNKDALQNILHKNSSDWDSTLDQLKARLGENFITTIDSTEDYRPEYSFIKRTYTNRQSFKKKFLSRPYRPIWLLEHPVQINNPISALQKIHNRERIADGWWDRNYIQRDYFIAKNKKHNLLWVFTDIKNQEKYFIHGYFA